MRVTILMCPCFAGGFHSCKSHYVKKFIHFYCKCRDEQKYFVCTSKGRPVLFSRLEGMKNKCERKNLGLFEMCEFCNQMRYLLNFDAINFAWKKFQNRWKVFWFPLTFIWDTILQSVNHNFKNNKVYGYL